MSAPPPSDDLVAAALDAGVDPDDRAALTAWAYARGTARMRAIVWRRTVAGLLWTLSLAAMILVLALIVPGGTLPPFVSALLRQRVSVEHIVFGTELGARDAQLLCGFAVTSTAGASDALSYVDRLRWSTQSARSNRWTLTGSATVVVVDRSTVPTRVTCQIDGDEDRLVLTLHDVEVAHTTSAAALALLTLPP